MMSRPVWIGGSALVFAGLVFAMIPPTKPLGGARIDPNSHHGPADLPVPKARPDVRPVAPAVPPAGFSGAAATVASAAGEAWPWRPAVDDDAPIVDASAPAPRVAPPAPRTATRPDPRAADREPEPVSVEEDRAFRAGYRWARQRDIDDPRACRGLDDGPGADGCAAYARVAQSRYSRDDPDGRGRRYARGDDEDDGPWR